MTLTIPSSIAEIVQITLPRGRNGNGGNHADVADDPRPIFEIDIGDLPKVAKQLRDLIAQSGKFFDRGGPVRIDLSPNNRLPKVTHLGIQSVVRAAHDLCRPVSLQSGKFVTLPERVASLYLDMRGEWHLPPLVAVTTAPILAKDGTIQTVAGFQPASRVYCCIIPDLDVPAKPTRAEAEAALAVLRTPFRTFPFADAKRKIENGVELVDLDQPMGYDESAFLCGLLTAICRQSLWLAPGLLLNAPSISGAGTGKGLLVRSIGLIAYGMLARPFPPGNDRHEMDKRLVAEVIQGNPIVFMDNVNGVTLRSDTLASFLTERPSQVRILGKSQMVQLELASFFALTGNGLVLSEDLARRFICVEFDAGCEDPEQREFPPGFLRDIEKRRPELLSAGLTILRWGRQNTVKPGRPLGSFEDWGEWVRDPLVALGGRDPVDRINAIKARDPERQRVISLFNEWDKCHGDKPIKVSELAEAVRLIADPNNRGRQYLARTIGGFAGTRLGGFLLERLEPTDARKQGACYRLLNSQISSASSASSAVTAPRGGGQGADDADAFQAPPDAVYAQCRAGIGTDPPSEQVIGRDGQAHWVQQECRRFWRGVPP
jgi:hypothetical protein